MCPTDTLWHFENDAYQKGFKLIAGVDEVGRGPLAGPVIAAAVILPRDFNAEGITDSKKLSPKKRNHFYSIIYQHAVSVGIGIVDTFEIDRVNILQASLRAMAFAIENLSPIPDFILIDGINKINGILDNSISQLAIPKGDCRSFSVAAASIVAKVTRDRLMDRYHTDYPLYAFDTHKGYGTKFHLEAIRKYGPCKIHRRSFKGVKEYIKAV